MPKVPDSILGGDVQFSFFCLVEKNSILYDIVKKFQVSLKWHRPFMKRTCA